MGWQAQAGGAPGAATLAVADALLHQRLALWPLPAGGFRGDWFLAISRGSVSRQLGLSIIDILCSHTEQYKRHARGVGLPVALEFTKRAKLRAWPGAEESGPSLVAVQKIWSKARSRSTIKHYREFRNVLYTLFCQLVGYRASPRKPADIIEALRAQYAVFDKLAVSAPPPAADNPAAPSP